MRFRRTIDTLVAMWRPAVTFFATFSAYAGRRRWLAVALVGLGALLDGAGLLLLIPILGAVVSGGSGHGRLAVWLARAGVTTPTGQLGVMLAAFVALALVRGVVQFSRDMTLGRLQTGFVEQQRNGVIALVAGAPWNRIAGFSHARINSLLTNDVARMAGGSQFLIQGLVALVMLVVQGALAFVLAPLLASVIAAVIGIGGCVLLLAQGRVRTLGQDMVDVSRAMMKSTGGLLGGLKSAAAQNGQARFVAEFAAIQAQMRERQLDFQRRQATNRRVSGIASALIGATVVFGGFATGVKPAVMITLVVIFSRMSGPAMQLQQAVQNFVFNLPSFEAVAALCADLAGDGSQTVAPIAPPPGRIELRDVRYLHRGSGGDSGGVHSADLGIAPGAFTGIAGPSGAGKTTLVDLITCLLEPQAGTITIGGAPLDAALRAGWRQSLAYVPQEGFLFHDSVRHNLNWGDDTITDGAMWQALVLSGGDVVVAGLREGLDTVVGERGALLSGGERQRIALARALLCAPRLLVLDEALNAVDAPSEAKVLARLAALDPRPTIVMVSHRAESLIHCDQVIIVENGMAREAAQAAVA